jgi:peptidyl-prolyl cis-trans isomerase C
MPPHLRTAWLVLLFSADAHQLAARIHIVRHAGPSRSTTSMGLLDSIKNAWESVEITERSASAAHILMKDRTSALLLKEQIDAGEIAFADAARQYSSCPSAGKGGSLGQFKPGEMAPAFDALVFDPQSSIGEVNVCATQFGTHLVKVLARTGVPPAEAPAARRIRRRWRKQSPLW